MRRRNADRTVKYKTRSSWKSIPQHSSSQGFSDVPPSQTYSTLDPVSPHLSTSYKQPEAGRTRHRGRCRGRRLCGSTWRRYFVVGWRSLGRGHIRGQGKTTDLRRCDKHSSQRGHPEPSDDSSPQTNTKDHGGFQPTGICFLIV